MSRTRKLVILITGLLVGAILAPTGAFSAAPDSASGIAVVQAGSRCKTVNAGMDVTAHTKVAATVVTNALGATVQRAARKAKADRLRICLEEVATRNIKVAWIAHNGPGLATAAHLHDGRYYTEAEADTRFVSAKEDSFYYVPGSLLEIHYQDGPAEVYFDSSSDAIVRKTGSAGYMRVLIPVPLPAELGGDWGKLVNFRVSYRVDNVNNYITHTWLNKSSNTGGDVELASDATDRKSTGYTSYVVDCGDPGCQLEWVPNGNYLTVTLGLQYGGIGSPHDITIGGVVVRVSYDG